jgi:hypothetical protein
MQNDKDYFEWLQDFVVSREFLEVLCLFTKNGGDGLDRVTLLEALGERMFGQIYVRLLLVVFQSGLKEHTQMWRP